MKRTLTPFKRTNGTKESNMSAKTQTQSLPQLVPWPSIEDSPPPPTHTMSPSQRLIPPPGHNHLPPPLTKSTPLTEDMKMRLHAKMEEDRRKQAEEKTHQASLVLEQRRIEQSILSDALRAGVPPKLVPLIFNGIYTTVVCTGFPICFTPCGAPTAKYFAPGVAFKAPSCIPPPQQSPKQSLQQSPKKSPQQSPKQSPQAHATGSPPTATKHLPEKRHREWSDATSRLHRDRVIGSEREQLRRKLKSQKVEFGGKELLDTAFEHTFPVTSSMIEALSPRRSAVPPNKASGTLEKRQQPPQKSHTRPSQESGRPQSQAKPQWEPHIAPRNPGSVSNAPSHVHPQQMNSPSPKRKNQRSHERVPPPQYRRHETVCGQQDPSDDPQLAQRQQQRDLSSSRESRTCDGGSSKQASESTPATVGKSSATTTQDFRKQPSHFQSISNVDSSNLVQGMVPYIKLE
ncbi:hypothetical protein N7516_004349 [Penicillium verrucosum]|uniref:uncharacterized protein n=1 Tax=Penicillium verrucosum TaxID=60171 RepID=UPI002545035A|nr:uncharacterized protein N7516_004349 [Penicillium verrucosum]KAJ5944181.1 hypothetical protein N7516_004349 [Penicillium verrucosum]